VEAKAGDFIRQNEKLHEIIKKRIGIHPTKSGSAWFQNVSNVFQFPSISGITMPSDRHFQEGGSITNSNIRSISHLMHVGS